MVSQIRLQRMPTIQIEVPDHLDMQISRLVDEGEFLDQTNAVEDLLSTGIRAYKTGGPMRDDAMMMDDGMMGHEDEYVF
jgi:hypothetical protein